MIRAFRPEDGAALAAIFSTARRAAMPWLATPHTPEQEAAFLTRTALPRAQVWVADVAGRPAGFRAREGEWVMHLYVAPGQQRRGLGSALLAAARQDGVPRLGLYVFQRNQAARAFYEAHGFRAIAFGDGSGNMEAEPDALYEWRGPAAPDPATERD